MPEPIVETAVEPSIEVAPSEDNGNIPAEEIAPVAPSEPIEPVVEETPTPVTEPELFDLPDGRKVDAATLATEFKQNFLPEFTRKSQELAELKKSQTPLPEQPKSPYEDPEYVPSSYEEVIKTAEQRAVDKALKILEDREREKVETSQALENAVVEQLAEVKKLDPTVNENQLFLHATKYGFRDLKAAHTNMKDMAELAKKVQQTTAQNIQKRADPVSVSPGATGASLNPDHFATSVEYLRALKGQ